MTNDTDFFSTKTLLTKLLAQENLKVEHRPGTDAYFDLETRTVVIPILKDHDNEIYDLLIGHEIAHAIYTPTEQWGETVKELNGDKEIINRGKQTFLNVVEDARIERLIKDKYPGLRRSFTQAYKKLNEMNFFGIKDTNVNRMKLIDRINLFFKLNGLVTVTFTQEELAYLDRINQAETFDDVKNIAEELYRNALLQQDDDEEEDDYDDSFEEEGDLNDWSDSDAEDWEGGLPEDDSDENDEEKTEEDDKKDKESNVDGSGEDEYHENFSVEDIRNPLDQVKSLFDEDEEEQNVSSVTDMSFRAMQVSLYEDVNVKTEFLNLPALPNNYLISHKDVYAEIKEHIDYILEHRQPKKTPTWSNAFLDFDMETAIDTMTNQAYSEMLRRVTPTVNYMVKEFEMRKNSKQLSRARVSKSGKIDTKKLYKFGFDSDIFGKMTSVDHGKNHGLVIFVDLSGSMAEHIVQTFEQAIALSIFCKKVNIPFEVYGFSNNDYYGKSHRHIDSFRNAYFKYEDNDLMLNFNCFRIKQYLSSTMSSTVFKDCMKHMMYVAKAVVHTQSYIFLPESERLYGTPLSEAILASGELVSQFKKNNNVHNVNCIFMTDGVGGNATHKYSSEKNVGHYINNRSKIYLTDPKTGNRSKQEDLIMAKDTGYATVDNFMTHRSIVEIMKKNTGAKYTGYYIGNKRTHCINLYPYEYVYVNDSLRKEHIKSMTKKCTETGFLSSKKFGFDQYFFVNNTDMKIDDAGFEVAADASKNKIAKAFMKSMEKMSIQRMFLNRFMENISN